MLNNSRYSDVRLRFNFLLCQAENNKTGIYEQYQYWVFLIIRKSLFQNGNHINVSIFIPLSILNLGNGLL